MPQRTWLIEAREAKGLSQVDAAHQIGIDNSYLAHIEAGRRTNLSPQIIQRIAEVYEVDAAQILKAVLAS